MIVFKQDISKSTGEQPIETWRLSKDLDGTAYPTIRDSSGDWFAIQTHSIADDGTVSPSVVCPYGCEFHEFITLEGWDQIEGKKQM